MDTTQTTDMANTVPTQPINMFTTITSADGAIIDVTPIATRTLLNYFRNKIGMNVWISESDLADMYIGRHQLFNNKVRRTKLLTAVKDLNTFFETNNIGLYLEKSSLSNDGDYTIISGSKKKAFNFRLVERTRDQVLNEPEM